MNKVGRDGLNLVVFRNRSWCHNERCGSGRTFPLAAAAMTTPLSLDGRLEADIELNGASYAWNDAPGKPGQRRADLGVVLAHEVGHLLGLGDACAAAHGALAATDCVDQDSIMYAPALLSAPSPRDVAEICRLYPRPTQRAELAAPASTRASSVGHVLLIVAACLLGLQVYGTRRARC